jgi:methylmalonyl-CoA/ethylmalonyl-CoA epimerase
MGKPTFGTFHHVGVAVKDLEAAAEQFESAFGATRLSEVLHDEEQGVRLLLMEQGNLQIELLEPAGKPSPLDSILKRGIGIYHVCHEVEDLDAELIRLGEAGVTLVSPPKPAIAFGGRRVAFVMCHGLMVELLEETSKRQNVERIRPSPNPSLAGRGVSLTATPQACASQRRSTETAERQHD